MHNLLAVFLSQHDAHHVPLRLWRFEMRDCLFLRIKHAACVAFPALAVIKAYVSVHDFLLQILRSASPAIAAGGYGASAPALEADYQGGGTLVS